MARKVSDKLTKEGKRIFTELAKLSGLQVKVGFTAEGGGHGVGGESVSAEGYDNNATVAQVATWNEFGTTNIPARPFMRQSVDNHTSEIAKMCDIMTEKVVTGEVDADKALRAIGALQVGLIQNEIREGDFEENAPSTVKQKGSSAPLINTGNMLQSVHYVVSNKEG